MLERHTIGVMSNPESASSHARGEQQPVNPYAASREASPVEMRDLRGENAHRSERQYRARMTWSDRRNLLLSVGPTRVSAICGALIWAKSTYDIMWVWYDFFLVDHLVEWGEFVLFGLAIVVIVQGFVAIYACVIEWRYADQLVAVAGGATSDMASWSRLHLRAAWLFATIAALSVVSEVGQWVLAQIATQRLFPV